MCCFSSVCRSVGRPLAPGWPLRGVVVLGYKVPHVVNPAVDAFNANGLPLLMVGQGSMLKRLKARAQPNIRFVDRLDFNALRRAYARARVLGASGVEARLRGETPPPLGLWARALGHVPAPPHQHQASELDHHDA